MIIDFEMKFNQTAVVVVVLNVLKKAAKENDFNGFKVNPNSIELISSPPTSTSSTKSTVSCFYFPGNFHFYAPYRCHLGKSLHRFDNLVEASWSRGWALNSQSSGPG